MYFEDSAFASLRANFEPDDEIGRMGAFVKGLLKMGVIMPETSRFGISINSSLLAAFDKAISSKGYTNRSEAIRDLIREHLVENEWQEEDRETVGAITLVYNHHLRELPDKLAELQHQDFNFIISALHVHLDEFNCLEVLVVKGKSRDVKKIADRLIGTKGVKHGKLVMTTRGRDLL